jgi:hypothetical protein
MIIDAATMPISLTPCLFRCLFRRYALYYYYAFAIDYADTPPFDDDIISAAATLFTPSFH